MTTEHSEPTDRTEPADPADPGLAAGPERPANDVALALFDYRLAQIGARETARIGRRDLWLAHHWPADYGERCVRIGSRHVCRRCAALYPLGFAVAFLAAAGLAPWPAALDPAAIWVLSVPATAAYVGEAVGLVRYDTRWQVGTTLLAALAFGRALGYELVDRWSSQFWGPIAVFGGIWFLASVFNVSAGAASRRR
ncbi:MAG: hypothetical protein OEV40_21950 [Acidimicrobiia bacterium]|nr:hypothetical protein [Acidimicrobiia bacterium]